VNFPAGLSTETGISAGTLAMAPAKTGNIVPLFRCQTLAELRFDLKVHSSEQEICLWPQAQPIGNL